MAKLFKGLLKKICRSVDSLDWDFLFVPFVILFISVLLQYFHTVLIAFKNRRFPWGRFMRQILKIAVFVFIGFYCGAKSELPVTPILFGMIFPFIIFIMLSGVLGALFGFLAYLIEKKAGIKWSVVNLLDVSLNALTSSVTEEIIYRLGLVSIIFFILSYIHLQIAFYSSPLLVATYFGLLHLKWVKDQLKHGDIEAQNLKLLYLERFTVPFIMGVILGYIYELYGYESAVIFHLMTNFVGGLGHLLKSSL